MRVLYRDEWRVARLSGGTLKVTTAGTQGPAAVPSQLFNEHVARRDNPHRVSLDQLVVPAGNAGKWVKIAADGTTLVLTAPPLTELPPMPDPADEKVAADPGDNLPGYLSAKVAGVLYVDETKHQLRLKGAPNAAPAAGSYYGTSDSGVLGFWPVPAGLARVSGITADNEDDLFDAGDHVGLFAVP